jgi:hypothetical protein
MGCAALLAASIAFPPGIVLGGNEPSPPTRGKPSRPAPTAGGTPAARNVYSPRIATDPYVIEQQRRVLQALEARCRQSGRLCREAEQARLRIEEADTGR